MAARFYFMDDIQKLFADLKERGVQQIKSAESLNKLQELKAQLLGAKAELTRRLEEIRTLVSQEEKKLRGKGLNEIKRSFE